MPNNVKTTILLMLFLLGVAAPQANAQMSLDFIAEQNELPKKRKKRGEKEDTDKRKFENFVLSTGFSLNYFNGLAFAISPSIGYQFDDRLRVNVGIDYYSFNGSERIGDQSIKSFGPFGNVQYLAFSQVFGQIQYQTVSYTFSDGRGNEFSPSEDSFLIGVGYAPNQFLPGFDFNFSLSYNVLFEDTIANPSIYGSPFVGVAVMTYRF